jgi:hypothetical protein
VRLIDARVAVIDRVFPSRIEVYADARLRFRTAARVTARVATMKMSDIPFGTTDWATVPATEHPGEKGMATWRTRHFGGIRVRMVEYSPGYVSDHWCEKGHILLCLDGELTTRLADGREFVLTAGMSYQVADGADPHSSRTASGARLFIVD